MSENKNIVLVIAAHPDDELLGCGGTVALHTKNGDDVYSLIVCEGESVRYSTQKVNQKNSTAEAAEVLGVKDVRMLDYPDQKLDTFNLTEIIQSIEAVVREIKPNIIYTQFGGDVNRDHELLFKAAMVATRPTEKYIEAVFAFDTASSTEWGYPRSFIPDLWVDIQQTLDIKLKAMARYESELCDYPHPRSLEGLKYRAHAWGNQCCLDAAEVFMTIRRVSRDGKTPV